MDKKEALKIVKKDGRELEKLSTHFKKDRKIVLEAVNSKSKGFGYGLPLKYADKSLRKDRQIVLLRASDEFCIDQVKETCQEKLVHLINAENVGEVYNKLSFKSVPEKLIQICIDFAIYHLESSDFQ